LTLPWDRKTIGIRNNLGGHTEDIEIALAQMKSSIEDLSKRKAWSAVPPSLLKEFKLTLDELRLIIWAVIMADEESSHRMEGLQIGLPGKLVEFRIKRLLEMLSDLEADVQDGNISAVHPVWQELLSALEESNKNITKFCAKERSSLQNG